MNNSTFTINVFMLGMPPLEKVIKEQLKSITTYAPLFIKPHNKFELNTGPNRTNTPATC